MPEPEPGPAPVPVASEPPQQQQRAFSLAVNAVPLEEPATRPMPLAAPTEPQVKIDGGEVTVTIGPRMYRVLGLEKCTSRGQMRVNVKVSGNECARRVLLSRRHAGHGGVPAAGGVRQAGRARAGGEGRDDPSRGGPVVDGARGPAAGADRARRLRRRKKKR